MTTAIQKNVHQVIEYPDDDGEPMADNTLQFKWIVVIKEGLEALFRHNPHVFVAGNLLWYAVENEPAIRMLPMPWSCSAGRKGGGVPIYSGKKTTSPLKSFSRSCRQATGLAR